MDSKGVQIVKISDDRTYEFDERALQQILLRDDVKDCAVVVLSIAGAYRGGKSFLLDFFLRYLYFKRENNNEKKEKAWLGDDNEPLKGFSWRGGSNPDTTGILIWSEPIHLSLRSGEKVVVLLMDTQGTFDSNSTVRDSSTIFALSTLLSSVQIYNVSHNIREDDLQHLQLFTEYGKLATSDGDRPFQKLLFLVRDWSYPYEYANGSTGGDQLLKHRLEVKTGQPEELQEIRQHISSSFDSVNCFLMPHPGFPAMSDPRFNGCLSEIRDEFKAALQELVPSLLSPENLTVKLINGRPVKARDFVDYFKTYVHEFNSDHLPTPLTVMQASAKVSLLSALNEARQLYYGKMAAACDGDALCLSPKALKATHADALREARLLLDNAPALKFVPQGDQDVQLTQLLEELSHSLLHYQVLNDEKNLNNANRSKEIYEETLLKFAKLEKLENLCLHPEDIKQVATSAQDSALSHFDANRIPVEDTEDIERLNLLLHFENREKQAQNINKLNNNSAKSNASDFYSTCMTEFCGTQPCMNPRDLEIKHEESRTRAVDFFKGKRNFYSEYPEDLYKRHLSKDIEERFSRLLTANEENNQDAVCAAEAQYMAAMRPLCAGAACVHPQHLRSRNSAAHATAVATFRNRRTGELAAVPDDFLRDLEQKLDHGYVDLSRRNNNNNATAVQEARKEYLRGMKDIHKSLLRKAEKDVASAHRDAMQTAEDYFHSRRKGPSYADDEYQKELRNDIARAYSVICKANRKKVSGRQAAAGTAGAVGAVVAGVAGLAFGAFRLLR